MTSCCGGRSRNPFVSGMPCESAACPDRRAASWHPVMVQTRRGSAMLLTCVFSLCPGRECRRNRSMTPPGSLFFAPPLPYTSQLISIAEKFSIRRRKVGMSGSFTGTMNSSRSITAIQRASSRWRSKQSSYAGSCIFCPGK